MVYKTFFKSLTIPTHSHLTDQEKRGASDARPRQ